MLWCVSGGNFCTAYVPRGSRSASRECCARGLGSRAVWSPCGIAGSSSCCRYVGLTVWGELTASPSAQVSFMESLQPRLVVELWGDLSSPQPLVCVFRFPPRLLTSSIPPRWVRVGRIYYGNCLSPAHGKTLWKHGPARCVYVGARVVGRYLPRALETPCCGVLQVSCCHPPALSMPLCGAAKCLRDVLKWSKWFTFPSPQFFRFTS